MQYGSRTILVVGVFLTGLFPWSTALSAEGVSLLDAKRAKIQSMHVEAVRDFLYLAPHEEQPFCGPAELIATLRQQGEALSRVAKILGMERKQ